MKVSNSRQRRKKIAKAVMLIHRYFALLMSIIFFAWCFSGFVMIYTNNFPSVDKFEQAKQKQAIDFSLIAPLSANHFLSDKQIKSLKITTVYNRPSYEVVLKEDDKRLFFYADVPHEVPKIDEELAITIAKDFNQMHDAEIAKVELVDELDKWLPRDGYLKDLPLYKVHFASDAKRVCYVAKNSGQVVQNLNNWDKFFAWIGPIPHWFYFKDLRLNTKLWKDVVIYCSLLGLVLCISGIVLGIIRTVNVRKRRKVLTPFKKGWYKWHHYLGLFFGLFAFTWTLSGLFSMNPWNYSSSRSITSEEAGNWRHKPFYTLQEVNEAVEHLKHQANTTTKSIQLTAFQGGVYWIADNSMAKQTALIASKDFNPKIIDTTVIKATIKGFNNTLIQAVKLLEAYDSYYYSRANKQPLPVYKITMNNAQNTVYYVDPASLEIKRKMQTDSRSLRWLYNGLHSFDFPGLINNRPLWDIIILFLLIGTTLLSYTGLKLFIGYVWRKLK